MKKIFIAALLLTGLSAAQAQVSEFFPGMDENAVKSGISKYIISKGGKVNSSEIYSSDTFHAVEVVQTSRGTFKYNYTFNVAPQGDGSRLDMSIYKEGYGIESASVGSSIEQGIMEIIKKNIQGRFLYGLGFEKETVSYNGKTYKIPKGRETGIVLTAAKYDAAKQGLLVGDIITEIEGVPLNEIPINVFATALHAKSMTDTLNLTCKRAGRTFNVTLTPRPSTVKTF